MKKFIIEIKWAFIFIIMMLFWMLLERLFGLHDTHIELHEIITNFVAIPAILIYVFALLDKRKNYYSGKMTYLQGFVSGIIISIIVAILSPLLQWVTAEIITPDFFANMIDYSVETGNLTKAEAEDFFNINNFIIQATIGAFGMGIVTSAIVAIFTRKV